VWRVGESAALSGEGVAGAAAGAELESLRLQYEQAARERDDVQRAYTHARHEVDILLHSLQQMKTERDRAIHAAGNAPSMHQPRAPPLSSGTVGLTG